MIISHRACPTRKNLNDCLTGISVFCTNTSTAVPLISSYGMINSYYCTFMFQVQVQTCSNFSYTSQSTTKHWNHTRQKQALILPNQSWHWHLPEVSFSLNKMKYKFQLRTPSFQFQIYSPPWKLQSAISQNVWLHSI